MLIGITLLLILSFILSICIGSVSLSLQDIIDVILNQSENNVVKNIVLYARLPRTVACMFSGAALAVSGAVIQSVLENKLASPGIIGVNAGAGLAVTICCAMGVFSGLSVTIASFIGASLATFIIVFCAYKIGASRSTLILAGVAVNSFLNAASESITVLLPDVGMVASDFKVGGFSSVAFSRVIPAGILIVLSILFLMTLCNELDILSLGEETAQGLGISAKKVRILFLIIASLLAGAAVSFSGLLGFVGLIIPHISRKFVQNDSYRLIPFCALSGACFVILSDLFARVLFIPYEIPVGILMSLIGGPFFLFLLAQKKRRLS